MKIALTGFENSGRTTIFRALSDTYSEGVRGKGRLKLNYGVTKIRDERLDVVQKAYDSSRKTQAEIVFQDFEFVERAPGERKGLDEEMIAHVKLADALIYVCRGFINENVYYPFPTIDPLRDAQNLESDMLLTDLSSTENRMSRIENDLRKGKKELQKEYDLMARIKTILDDENPLRLHEFNEEEDRLIKGFEYLTRKKGMVIVNVADDMEYPGDAVLLENWAKRRDLSYLLLRGKLQADLKELDEDERIEFLKELGVEKQATDIFIQEIYNTLGLIQFFTANQTEARAWDIPKGATAFDAAGVVHTDFQEKFIRAEVMTVSDLMKYGSEKACKESGVYRVEKKEYVVQDGDVIFFRHG